ncbi:MAG: 50S ribosomal protein L11 methyltransferase [Deltaproteobacteria bacterium]|nr:50S ribosomal protein L11 methyltransferase [Deltaproteobacteria bacterium]
MKPETLLTIFELRAKDKSALELLDAALPTELFGPTCAKSLRGLHFEADFAFLFFDAPVDLEQFLKTYPIFELRQIHTLRYDQWQDGAGSPPIDLGELRIVPSFDSKQLSQEKKQALSLPPTIFIDPGLAFGYGGHPTTKTCLEFLISIYKPKYLGSKKPATSLDLGCGTGVLALAAAKLGAKRVLGVDHSHLAVEAARKNLTYNRLAHKVTIERGLAQNYARRPSEVVLANIPLFVLSDLVSLGAFDERSHLIVSGLLPDEGDVFLKALMERNSYEIIDAVRTDRWISYWLKMSSA